MMGTTYDSTAGARIVPIPVSGFQLIPWIGFDKDTRERIVALVGEKNLESVSTIAYVGLQYAKEIPWPQPARKGRGPLFVYQKPLRGRDQVAWDGMQEYLIAHRKKARDVAAFLHGLEAEFRAYLVLELMLDENQSDELEASELCQKTDSNLTELCSRLEQLALAIGKLSKSSFFRKKKHGRTMATRFVVGHLFFLWTRIKRKGPSPSNSKFLQLVELAVSHFNPEGSGIEGMVKQQYNLNRRKAKKVGSSPDKKADKMPMK